MDHLLEFFYSEHDEDLLGDYPHMLQSCLLVSHPSKFYTVSTLLFHKYRGANIAVKNCMSHFSMFVPAKVSVKLDNGNTVHAQGMGIILCRFPNYSIIYPVVPVYYFPGHPSSTISSSSLKVYVGFQNSISEPL